MCTLYSSTILGRYVDNWKKFFFIIPLLTFWWSRANQRHYPSQNHGFWRDEMGILAIDDASQPPAHKQYIFRRFFCGWSCDKYSDLFQVFVGCLLITIFVLIWPLHFASPSARLFWTKKWIVLWLLKLKFYIFTSLS